MGSILQPCRLRDWNLHQLPHQEEETRSSAKKAWRWSRWPWWLCFWRSIRLQGIQRWPIWPTRISSLLENACLLTENLLDFQLHKCSTCIYQYRLVSWIVCCRRFLYKVPHFDIVEESLEGFGHYHDLTALNVSFCWFIVIYEWYILTCVTMSRSQSVHCTLLYSVI